jgi:hypothetical protein
MRAFITLAVLGLALVVVPGALAERSFTDPAGDSGPAPDITSVRVAHDAAGLLSFAVTTTQPTLAADAWFWVYIDTDRSASTGQAVQGIGADLMLLSDGDGGLVFRIQGSSLIVDFQSGLQAAYANGTFTAQLNRTALGSTDRFAFVVESEQDDANGDAIGSDFAPDAAPAYEYSFVPLVLTAGPVKATPKRPLAGKRFAVSAAVTRSDGQPFTAGTVRCSARAGSAGLKPAGSVTAGSARCVMTVPKKAKGKVLRGSLTVSAEDSAPVTRTFAIRVP